MRDSNLKSNPLAVVYRSLEASIREIFLKITAFWESLAILGANTFVRNALSRSNVKVVVEVLSTRYLIADMVLCVTHLGRAERVKPRARGFYSFGQPVRRGLCTKLLMD